MSVALRQYNSFYINDIYATATHGDQAGIIDFVFEHLSVTSELRCSGKSSAVHI